MQLQDWQQQTTVVAITNNGYNIQVSSKAPEDIYYSAGILSKDNADFRRITDISGNVFALISPLDALKVGDNIQIAKGCDRSAAACQSFNNFDNFFGFLAIPTDNPFQVY
ncbi:phage BR0599 family protein [Pseudomonas caspiana]